MEQRTENKKLTLLTLRYTLALLLGFFIGLFYKIFTPLTLRTLYLALSTISNVSLSGYSIIVNGIVIDIIPACVSGSAYYLLFALGMLTQMNILKRLSLILFDFFMFFMFNILRILFLIYLLIKHVTPSLYDIIHKSLWFFLSTLLILFIWWLSIKLFDVRSIPLVSDIQYIVKTKHKKNKKLAN